MGKVLSVVSRKLNRFNVESRAHKILDRDKPIPAPKYESNLKDLARAMKEDPDFIQRESKKDPALDKLLKQVYVTSKDTPYDYGIKRKEDESRPLPGERGMVDDFEYGFQEPTKIAIGRCTLRQAMKFITDFQSDPSTWTKQKIADEYKIKLNNVDKILEFFKSFQVYTPDATGKERLLSHKKEDKLLEVKSDKNNT